MVALATAIAAWPLVLPRNESTPVRGDRLSPPVVNTSMFIASWTEGNTTHLAMVPLPIFPKVEKTSIVHADGKME